MTHLFLIFIVFIGSYIYGTIHALCVSRQFNKIPKRRNQTMKRFLMIVLAVLMGVSLVVTVFAQTTTDKPAKAATDTAKEKAAPAPAPEKKAAVKEKSQKFAGEVTAVDMAAKTLAVKGKKGEMTFDVTNAKMKAEPKAGDKVFVKYTEKDGKMVAKLVAAKKGSKKAAKKDAAPTDKPAAPAPAAK
jgi:glucose/arabinose dehydrogenase